MQTRFMKRAVCGAVAAAAVLATGVAQAALQDRDLNGDTVVDAFYDTDLNITWLRDANVNGPMNWATAVSWADNLSFGGYTDWRLPTSDSCSPITNCSGSEMGHLWYAELGNPAGGPVANVGGFQNLPPPGHGQHWTGREHATIPGLAWFFRTTDGYQNYTAEVFAMYAMAVRPGDVAAIPEPQTYALLLTGLSALLLAVRRRPR